MLRYMTAGESHGPALVAIVEGMPAGVSLDRDVIGAELARRQLGFGRSVRMKLEEDSAEILSGLRFGKTIGSPIAVKVANRVYDDWRQVMAADGKGEGIDEITAPRPGHADLAGIMKMRFSDIRNVLERASARETAVRVAVGAIAKSLLAAFDIRVISHVTAIGGIDARQAFPTPDQQAAIDESPVRCLDEEATAKIVSLIEEVTEAGVSLGGTFEVLAFGCPPGLGIYTSASERLDALLAQSILSVLA